MNMNKNKFIFLSLIILIVSWFVGMDVLADVDPTIVIVGEGFCGETSVQRVLVLVGYLLVIVKIAVPLILIVIGTIDLMQAVTGKDDKSLTKSLKTLLLRVLLGVLIFFIPTIVNVVFDLIYETSGSTENTQCINCLLEPSECAENIKEASKKNTENTAGVADKNGVCPENYIKGIDGICYKEGVCGSYASKDTCPAHCKWSSRNGCQSK